MSPAKRCKGGSDNPKVSLSDAKANRCITMGKYDVEIRLLERQLATARQEIADMECGVQHPIYGTAKWWSSTTSCCPTQRPELKYVSV